MKITNEQPIPFRVTLSADETSDFIKDLVSRFGPSLPAGLLSGRTFTSLQFTFTNPATGLQTGTGSVQITAVPVAPAPVAPATTAVAKPLTITPPSTPTPAKAT